MIKHTGTGFSQDMCVLWIVFIQNLLLSHLFSASILQLSAFEPVTEQGGK